jgi:Lipocalin-like domain
MKESVQKFVGNWELLEWKAESDNGKTIHPFGSDAKGVIAYDGQGRMAVQIMKANRPAFLSQDPLQGKPEEKIDAYDGFLAYSGSYQVDEALGQVIHNVNISSFPNWIGQAQVRDFKFKDDLLILSTAMIGSWRHKLIWKKGS